MIQDGAVLIYVSMWTHAVDRINWYSTPSESQTCSNVDIKEIRKAGL